jgi:hypothetical protein
VDDSHKAELIIQGCTFQGAPAATPRSDELVLGGLMYVGNYSLASITDSQLICLYSSLVKWWVHAHRL